jgi:hypothetical protein
MPLSPEQALIRGWNVIPVLTDKRPAIRSWKQFQQQRISVTQIHEWARKLRPKAWAVVTGAVSGVIVLDFDGATGNETLKRFGFSPHIRTGTGGHHVYIQHPGFRVPTLNGTTKEQLGLRFPGMDIRGDGGYAIFAGANHAGPYELLLPPDAYPFESLPAELRELLMRVQEESQRPNVTAKAPKPSTGEVPSERLLRQALERVATDGRNNAGFGLAVQL